MFVRFRFCPQDRSVASRPSGRGTQPTPSAWSRPAHAAWTWAVQPFGPAPMALLYRRGRDPRPACGSASLPRRVVRGAGGGA